ncbi:MAG: 2-oxoglutarate and iron-dependent oxygenase domain-containing protein [Pseudomonadota bacterium]
MTLLADVPHIALPDYAAGGARRAGFVDALFDGLTRTGFVILVDHGISEDLLERAYAASETFFALPDAAKRAYIVGEGRQRGYTPFGEEHAKDSAAPDLKEFWHVGRETAGRPDLAGVYAPNVWPEEITDFMPAMLGLYDGLERAGLTLLQALTGPLDLPADYFDAIARDGNSILRLLHYPPIPEGADPASVRAAAHEDINLITLLVAASASGLELKDHEGRWRPIAAPRNAIIADAGDMLARITGRRIPATTHRVVNPTGPNVSRYSAPFFLHPRPDAVLSRIPSCRDLEPVEADITADDFLKERLREIGLL